MADVATTRDEYGAYKYQWARYLSRKSLASDVDLVKKKLAEIDVPPTSLLGDLLPDVQPGQSLREIAQGRKLAFGSRPKRDGSFKVGIVGAGVSGIFTGLLIDWLNGASNGQLNIEYDILEAAEENRVGGRLYTHKFSDAPHDYYDVGAMRFPKNQVMERTFRLFNFLGITEGSGPGKLRRYFYLDQEDGKGVCPAYYNHIRKVGPYAQYNPQGLPDSFNVNSWVKGTPEEIARWSIPEELIKQDPGKIIDTAIEEFTNELRKDMDNQLKQTTDDKPTSDKRIDDQPTPGDSKYKGWTKLMHADYQSVRQFLRDGAGKDGKGYNFNTIEWLETFALATGWYNQSLSETILETLDFDPPGKKASNDYWWCIDGGTQQVATKMVERLQGNKPEVLRQVTAINNDRKSGDIKLTIRHCRPKTKEKEKIEEPWKYEERSYFTVFNSTTLAALQKMDLTKADLNYGTKQAIRSLNYGASCKVGMKFKTGWWMKEPYNINQGGIGRTDLPLRVCVYPSYNVDDNVNEPMVLLCSYTWANDAQRLGGLIREDSPENEGELKDLLLQNLARLHAEDDSKYEALLEKLRDEYITHHAYDWYHDPNTLGAFGYFGPGQFSQMWPEIIKPSGWLFFIGEAASAHHGWICGAIESSVRAVFQLLETLQLQGEQEQGPDWEYKGYKEAMDRLIGPQKVKETDVPFIGLPREIPHRQAGTKKDDPTQDTPIDMNVDLSFTAAQFITAFFEILIDIAAEDAQDKKH